MKLVVKINGMGNRDNLVTLGITENLVHPDEREPLTKLPVPILQKLLVARVVVRGFSDNTLIHYHEIFQNAIERGTIKETTKPTFEAINAQMVIRGLASYPKER